MTNPFSPNEPIQPGPHQVEDLITSPVLVRALESDECCLVLDHVPIAIAVARQVGNAQRICFANNAFQALTGLSGSDIEGQNWTILDAFVHEDEASMPLSRAVTHGEDFLGTFAMPQNGNGPLLVQAYSNTIENEDGTENYRIAALVDVTHQERAAREAYEQQIRDRDMLLKELQHRVKNNLQLITALIRLEARNAQRGDAVDFDRLAGRIESLALLYQALSTDGAGPEVDLAPYLTEITSAATRTYSGIPVRLELKVSYAPVSVNVAMPVGLLVNELLTNAFKYAFPRGEDGTLTVECARADDESYRVVVSDDGCGFPLGVNWPARGKLGALILQTLRENTREMQFHLDSEPGQGTRVTIEFLTKPSRKPN
jgi:PAS domain S-box-containing protein